MSFFPNPEIVSMLTASGQWDRLRSYMNTGGLSASATPYYPARSLGVDWGYCVSLPFTRPTEKAPVSKHPVLFKMLKIEYEEHPERFVLSSEGHHGPDGRYYFSIKYDKNVGKSWAYANLHVFGRTDGFKFLCDSIDILMGDYEIYENAVVFK